MISQVLLLSLAGLEVPDHLGDDIGFPPLGQEIASPEFINYTDAMGRCVWQQPAVYASVSTMNWFTYKMNRNSTTGAHVLSPMPMVLPVATSGMYAACDVMGGSFCYGTGGIFAAAAQIQNTVCVLPTCTEEDLNLLLEKVLRPLVAQGVLPDPTGAAASLTGFSCHNEDPMFKDDSNAIGVVAFLSALGFVSILCSLVCRLYEARDPLFYRKDDHDDELGTNEATKLMPSPVNRQSDVPAVPAEMPYLIKLCYCWDLHAGLSELMSITKRPTNFFNMMKVASSVWIIYFHAPGLPYENGIDNLEDVVEYYKEFRSLPSLAGLYAVDTFFFMSAFLLAMIGTRSWPHKAAAPVQAKRVGMSYVDRYVRIVPAYGVCLLAAYNVFMYISSGPFTRLAVHGGSMATECGDKWWRNLLFISNFDENGGCFGHCWYLACDFQLLILGVLLVLGYVHWSRPTVVFTSFLVLVSLVVCFFRTRGTSSPFVGGFNENYMVPWIRAPPYLYGLLAAFAYSSKDVNERVKAVVERTAMRYCGYCVSAAIMIGCCFIPWSAQRDVFRGEMWSKDQIGWSQVAYHMLWGVGLAILTLTFVNGHGGWVKDMMAHPVWEPLSKLTFSVYLIHPMILGIVKLSYGPNLVHFSSWWLALITGNVTVGSFVAAALLFLFVERPVASTWSLVSGRAQRRAAVRK